MFADVLSCPLTKPCLEDMSGGYFADMSPHVCNVLSCPLTKPCPDAGHFQLSILILPVTSYFDFSWSHTLCIWQIDRIAGQWQGPNKNFFHFVLSCCRAFHITATEVMRLNNISLEEERFYNQNVEKFEVTFIIMFFVIK